MVVGSVSLPSRERGLKYFQTWLRAETGQVAPLAGARIEILGHVRAVRVSAVAPLVGARIEIRKLRMQTVIGLVAPLAGARIEMLS